MNRNNFSTLRLFASWAFFGIISFSSLTLSAQTKYTENFVQNLIERQQDWNLETTDYQDIEITAQYTDDYNNITHIYVQQEHEGIDLIDGTLGFHLNKDGELVHATNHFYSNKKDIIKLSNNKISAKKAVKTVLNYLNIQVKELTIAESSKRADEKAVFAKGEMSVYDMPARLVYQKTANNELQLAWQVEVYTIDQQHYWVTKVNAETGEIINKHDLVISCTFEKEGHVHGATCAHNHSNKSVVEKALEAIPTVESAFENMTTGANFYRVYDAPVEAPTFGDRTLVGTSGDLGASPLGWHDDGLQQYSITRGNNVFAYQDPGPASTPIPAVGGLPGQQPLVFDFEADLSLTPVNYRDAAITNLFYWNNLIHDIFYEYGFTEPAGNFQFDNFAKGGEGLDAVLAEAQDGSGVNNANFLTLADGLPGRMQMFLWAGVPVIDGDFDNGVILHEYGHGISTRLTGGPAQTCLSGDEQGGEGWSDYFGLMVTMNPTTVPNNFAIGQGMGTYVSGEQPDGAGIRPAKYSTDFAVNNHTYGGISDLVAPHGVGFLWCTMLWEMTASFVDLYGFDSDIVNGTGGNNIAMQLVMDGLKLQPCGPTFIEQRDAILAADVINHGGAHQCLIWEAFAKRGLGFSATAGTNLLGDETEAYDMPPINCLPFVRIESTVTDRINDGENFDIVIDVINSAVSTINGVNVSNEIPEGTTFVGATHPATISGNTVSFNNLSVPANTTETIVLTVSSNTGSNTEIEFIDDLELNPFNWTASAGLDQFQWSTADAFSGDYSFFCANPNNFSEIFLTLNETVTVTEGMELRFAHRYNTEGGFDGGWVEISNDGGQLWTNMGPLFVQNGYDSFVAAADNPLINGFCFGGISDGFIHSRADLSAFFGQDIQVRFRFASDVLTAAEGWYIDDVEFLTNPHLIYNNATFNMNNGTVGETIENEILVIGNNAQLSIGNANTGINTNSASESLAVTLYPNPATEMVNLNIEVAKEGVMNISVMNMQGQIMRNAQMEAYQGLNQLQMPVQNLTSGIYMVQVTQGKAIQTKRLMIQ